MLACGNLRVVPFETNHTLPIFIAFQQAKYGPTTTKTVIMKACVRA